jgi:hypothetical protein
LRGPCVEQWHRGDLIANGEHFLDAHASATRLLRFRHKSGGERLLFECAPDRVLDRKSLRLGQAFGEGFCFVREVNHR